MIDTEAGAKASAIIYSIAETAKANSLKTYHYFEYLLTEISKHLDDTVWMTCSPGHRTSLRIAGSPVKMNRNENGADLFLS